MQSRIYVVEHKGKFRLVDAISQSQAIRHCAKGDYKAHVAGTKDVAKHMSEGVKIEQAFEDESV